MRLDPPRYNELVILNTIKAHINVSYGPYGTVSLLISMLEFGLFKPNPS